MKSFCEYARSFARVQALERGTHPKWIHWARLPCIRSDRRAHEMSSPQKCASDSSRGERHQKGAFGYIANFVACESKTLMLELSLCTETAAQVCLSPTTTTRARPLVPFGASFLAVV